MLSEVEGTGIWIIKCLLMVRCGENYGLSEGVTMTKEASVLNVLSVIRIIPLQLSGDE